MLSRLSPCLGRNLFKTVHTTANVRPVVPSRAAPRAVVRVLSTSPVASSDPQTTVEDHKPLQDVNCPPRLDVDVPSAPFFVQAPAEQGSGPSVDPSFVSDVVHALLLGTRTGILGSSGWLCQGTSTVPTHPSTPSPIYTTAARASSSQSSNVRVCSTGGVFQRATAV